MGLRDSRLQENGKGECGLDRRRAGPGSALSSDGRPSRAQLHSELAEGSRVGVLVRELGKPVGERRVLLAEGTVVPVEV